MPTLETSSNNTFGSGYPPDAVIDHMLSQAGIQRTPTPKLSLFQYRGFIDDSLCREIVALIDTKRRPSELANYNGDTAFRTSETCDLDSAEPTVAELERRITAFTGLDPDYGEPIQGQRYAVGQEFKGHTDYFEPSSIDYEKFCALTGNRTWTVMIYLNEPEAGGATRFKAIDKIVQPETGKLLAWNNLRADGTCNPTTIHQGMKVRAGVKYVVTKWYRERPWTWGLTSVDATPNPYIKSQ